MIYYTNFHIIYRIIDAQGLYCCCLLQLNTFHIPFRYIIIIHTLLVSTKQVMLRRLIHDTLTTDFYRKNWMISAARLKCAHIYYIYDTCLVTSFISYMCLSFVFIHIYVLCFMYMNNNYNVLSLYTFFYVKWKIRPQLALENVWVAV